ncbi:hypothetical protein [Maribellus sediminis]|uniref:hypothetical protein n=1 Tax=Maribellus sediminis TaxID=2696285 RepID=UPI001430E064|nr:hypothetical protein [Maribellus sediminis]
MRKEIYKLLYLFIILTGVKHGYTQQLPSIKTGHDSIYFSNPYPYILPILGSKVHQANIRLPFPVGLMFNTLTGQQNLGLNNMQLGFGNVNNPTPPEMIDLSDIVSFDDITAQTATFNMRIDAWILPFLNLYGIVGQTKKADINVNLIKPIPLSVSTEVSGTYIGYGAMAAGALGPLFISLDVNRTYNYNPRLDNPAKVLIAGLRTGPVFKFKNNPKMNISVWTGAMYSSFNSNTLGSIKAIELAPDAPAEIDKMIGNLDGWYEDLSPADKIKYYLPYTKLNDGLTNLKNGISNGYIRYSFNKAIEKPWNMLVGAQWQINYRWQVRAEAQFLGDRTAGLFSLNYRFGIRGKNWFSKDNPEVN